VAAAAGCAIGGCDGGGDRDGWARVGRRADGRLVAAAAWVWRRPRRRAVLLEGLRGRRGGPAEAGGWRADKLQVRARHLQGRHSEARRVGTGPIAVGPGGLLVVMVVLLMLLLLLLFVAPLDEGGGGGGVEEGGHLNGTGAGLEVGVCRQLGAAARLRAQHESATEGGVAAG